MIHFLKSAQFICTPNHVCFWEAWLSFSSWTNNCDILVEMLSDIKSTWNYTTFHTQIQIGSINGPRCKAFTEGRINATSCLLPILLSLFFSYNMKDYWKTNFNRKWTELKLSSISSWLMFDTTPQAEYHKKCTGIYAKRLMLKLSFRLMG